MAAMYDIIVYGASGFAGKLCARYLQKCSSSSTTKFAIAGRSRPKLEAVARDIGAPDTPVLIADSGDEEALREMVKKTKVVLTTVGPYTLYGSTLVKVCAENGVHCVDLTGEAFWAYEMKRLYEDAARKTKAIFIHGAGFDSVPGDMCTYLAVKKLRSLTTASCGLVATGYIAKGGISGGTFGSMLVAAKASRDANRRKVMSDPYCLSPVKGQDTGLPMLTFKDGNRVGSFWVMETANAPVVRQTWGTLEAAAKQDSSKFSFGPDFRYREYLIMPNRFVAGMVSLSIFTFFILLSKVPFFHRLAEKYGPQSGDGPSEETMQNGHFKVTAVARSVDKKHFTRSVMKGRADPGYLGTSIMICEVALGLVHDHDSLTDLAKQGGHLTAALVFGDNVLQERLEKTGKFEFRTDVVDGP